MKALTILCSCLMICLAGLLVQPAPTDRAASDEAVETAKNNRNRGRNNRNRNRVRRPRTQKVDASVREVHPLHTKEDEKRMQDLVRAGNAATGNRGGARPTPAAEAANAALQRMRKQGSGFDKPKPQPKKKK